MTSIDSGGPLDRAHVAGGPPAHDVGAAVVAMRCSVHVLSGEVARLAAEIADVMEQIAVQRDRLAATIPDRAGELRAGAERARRYADHERREQERWLRVHDGLCPWSVDPAPSTGPPDPRRG